MSLSNQLKALLKSQEYISLQRDYKFTRHGPERNLVWSFHEFARKLFIHYCGSTDEPDEPTYGSEVFAGNLVAFGQSARQFFEKCKKRRLKFHLIIEGPFMDFATKEELICWQQWQLKRAQSAIRKREFYPIVSRLLVPIIKRLALEYEHKFYFEPEEFLKNSRMTKLANQLKCPIVTDDFEIFLYNPFWGFVATKNFLNQIDKQAGHEHTLELTFYKDIECKWKNRKLRSLNEEQWALVGIILECPMLGPHPFEALIDEQIDPIKLEPNSIPKKATRLYKLLLWLAKTEAPLLLLNSHSSGTRDVEQTIHKLRYVYEEDSDFTDRPCFEQTYLDHRYEAIKMKLETTELDIGSLRDIYPEYFEALPKDLLSSSAGLNAATNETIKEALEYSLENQANFLSFGLYIHKMDRAEGLTTCDSNPSFSQLFNETYEIIAGHQSRLADILSRKWGHVNRLTQQNLLLGTNIVQTAYTMNQRSMPEGFLRSFYLTMVHHLDPRSKLPHRQLALMGSFFETYRESETLIMKPDYLEIMKFYRLVQRLYGLYLDSSISKNSHVRPDVEKFMNGTMIFHVTYNFKLIKFDTCPGWEIPFEAIDDFLCDLNPDLDKSLVLARELRKTGRQFWSVVDRRRHSSTSTSSSGSSWSSIEPESGPTWQLDQMIQSFPSRVYNLITGALEDIFAIRYLFTSV